MSITKIYLALLLSIFIIFSCASTPKKQLFSASKSIIKAESVYAEKFAKRNFKKAKDDYVNALMRRGLNDDLTREYALSAEKNARLAYFEALSVYVPSTFERLWQLKEQAEKNRADTLANEVFKKASSFHKLAVDALKDVNLEKTIEHVHEAMSYYEIAVYEAKTRAQEIKDLLKLVSSKLMHSKKSKTILKQASDFIDEASILISKWNFSLAHDKLQKAQSLISDGPYVRLSISPLLFSPDEDGSYDKLKIDPIIHETSHIIRWEVAIFHKDFPDKIVKRFYGDKKPSEPIIWDGFRADGRLVESLDSYTITMNVADINANEFVSPSYNVLTDVLVNQVELGYKINLTNLDLTKDKLSTEDEFRLSRIARKLTGFSEYKIIVEGHTDNTGKASYNKVLSLKRARAVSKYLNKAGISAERLYEMGLGESTPRYQNTDQETRQKNRRVSFLLIKKQENLNEYFNEMAMVDLGEEVK